MVEGSVGKNASPKNAMLGSVTSLLDDFFVGTTHDGNFDEMMAHYAAHGSSSIHDLPDFFASSGLEHTDSDIARFFRGHHAIDTDLLNEPSSWKFASLD